MVIFPRYDAPAELEDDEQCVNCNDSADGEFDGVPMCELCAKDWALKQMEEYGTWRPYK